MPLMKNSMGCKCCGKCHCLRFLPEPNYGYDVHCRFDAAAFGVHLAVLRDTTDPHLWKGFVSGPSFGRVVKIGVRVPENGKPRILFHADSITAVPNTITWSDFDGLNGRAGRLWECDSGVWNLLESNMFSWLGRNISTTGEIDGIATVPLISDSGFIAHSPNDSFCQPSYTPDNITLRFDNWSDTASSLGTLRRSNFNGMDMSLPLTASLTNGSRRLRNYGSFVDPLGPAFYSDGQIICAGNPAWPAQTIRWRPRCQVNMPVNPEDGTATHVWVVIVEDWIPFADVGTGCYTTFSDSFIVPQFVGFYKFIGTFDQILDDDLQITHWIKKGDTSVNNSIPDGLTYWTSVSNFNSLAAPIGDLVRLF